MSEHICVTLEPSYLSLELSTNRFRLLVVKLFCESICRGNSPEVSSPIYSVRLG